MPGWIIQGVRGEGKSLCAVNMIKDYLLRGCPVATNLDLFLENLLPKDNHSIAYRLPDCPRPDDLMLLPAAYDPKYKGEDKNGLIVLDELALWMNCRNWKQAGRQQIIEWLLQSRKDHWDLVLLCQDHEMIDNQAKTTLCDYLVQASRTDRKKIPYVGKILKMFGINHYLPKQHLYDVYYGFNGLDNPDDTWKVKGTDIYDGYDTNQKFSPGFEIHGKKAVDMRALSTYLPAAYLTKQVYLNRLQDQIDSIIDAVPIQKDKEGDEMAKRKTHDKTALKFKMYALGFFLLAVSGWGYWKYKHSSLITGVPTAQVAVQSGSFQSPVVHSQDKTVSVINGSSSSVVSVSQAENSFLDTLMVSYKPRLAAYLFNRDRGAFGIVEFYDGAKLIERLKLSDLRKLGVVVIPQTYGISLVTGRGTYIVTSWPLTEQTEQAIAKIEKVS